MLLNFSQNSQKKHLSQKLFFNKAGAGTAVLEVWEIFKNTFFTEHLWWLLLEVLIHHFHFCQKYISCENLALPLTFSWEFPDSSSSANFITIIFQVLSESQIYRWNFLENEPWSYSNALECLTYLFLDDHKRFMLQGTTWYKFNNKR